MRLVAGRSSIRDEEKASFEERGKRQFSNQIGPESPSTGDLVQGASTHSASMEKLDVIRRGARTAFGCDLGSDFGVTIAKSKNQFYIPYKSILCRRTCRKTSPRKCYFKALSQS